MNDIINVRLVSSSFEMSARSRSARSAKGGFVNGRRRGREEGRSYAGVDAVAAPRGGAPCIEEMTRGQESYILYGVNDIINVRL